MDGISYPCVQFEKKKFNGKILNKCQVFFFIKKEKRKTKLNRKEKFLPIICQHAIPQQFNPRIDFFSLSLKLYKP